MLEIRSKDIKLVDVESIIPNPKNANRHSVEQIKRLEKLIKYQGFRNPLIISNRTGFLIAGHGRLEAAKNLGIEKLPVIYQDFENEAQEYSYLISDNEIARWAELDKQAVYEDLKNIELDDIELLGIEDFEIPDVEVLDPQTDEDEVPEVEHPITRRGDVWLLGKHRLMCGDSTMIDDVEKLMNGKKADMVFTDPPYGIDLDTEYVSNESVKGNNYKKIKDDDKEYDASFLCEYYGNIEQFWWGANYYQDTLPKGGSWIVWDKSNEQQDKAIGSDFEICYSTKKHKNRFYRKLWKGFTAKEKNEKRVHPTQKPIDMVVWFFDEYGKKSNLVVDNFLGSGTTLIASEKSSKTCYGMEYEEHYCDVIINRWQNYTGKKATLESTGQTYEELKAERL